MPTEEMQTSLLPVKEAHSCGKSPKWMVVAVNKVDLFKDKLPEAEKYYHMSMNSEFTQIAHDTLLHYIGKNNLKIISLPICSWQTDFEWNGETIQSTIGGSEAQRALFRYFLQRISELTV